MANEVVLILQKLVSHYCGFFPRQLYTYCGLWSQCLYFTSSTILQARGGRTICATIHSPTSFAFNLFDELLMLKKGEVIYSGPLGNDAAHARSYFSSLGFMPPGQGTGSHGG